jgi:hypothetical protein
LGISAAVTVKKKDRTKAPPRPPIVRYLTPEEIKALRKNKQEVGRRALELYPKMKAERDRRQEHSGKE